MDAYVIIKLKIKDIIDQESLDEAYDGNMSACVKDSIENEGLGGVIEDDYRILDSGSLSPVPGLAITSKQAVEMMRAGGYIISDKLPEFESS